MNTCLFPVLLLHPSIILQLHFLQPETTSRTNSVVLSNPQFLRHLWLFSFSHHPRLSVRLGSTCLWQLYSLPYALLVASKVLGFMSSPATLSTTVFLDWNTNYVAEPKHAAGVWHGSRANGFPYPILKVSTFLISPLFSSVLPSNSGFQPSWCRCFNIVPHVVVIPNHKIIFVAIS